MINVPFELVVDGVTTTARSFIDPASVNSTTVAIVRVSGSGAPALVDPTVVATAIGALQVFPSTGYAPGERYVAAVRGGPSGVKTNDGQDADSASSPIYLISNGVNLGSPETRPSTLTPQQVTDLTKLQSVLANPLDWVKVPSAAACAAALGAPQARLRRGLLLAAVDPRLRPAAGRLAAGPERALRRRPGLSGDRGHLHPDLRDRSDRPAHPR